MTALKSPLVRNIQGGDRGRYPAVVVAQNKFKLQCTSLSSQQIIRNSMIWFALNEIRRWFAADFVKVLIGSRRLT
jgi:hypothetical protein